MDFTAQLNFKTTAAGGRQSFAMNGYRPHIKFEFDDFCTSGQQIYRGKDRVFPGDSVLAEITILATEHFRNKLEKGMPFNFYEVPNIIGNGIIMEIVNSDLKKYK